jgi:hypothetical protein
VLIFAMSFLVVYGSVNRHNAHHPETGRFPYREKGSYEGHFSLMVPWLLHA